MNTPLSVTSILFWLNTHPLVSGALLIWSLIWKGFALWRSAELRQKYWFIALLLLNTIGLFDIFYLLFVAKGYKVEVVEN